MPLDISQEEFDQIQKETRAKAQGQVRPRKTPSDISQEEFDQIQKETAQRTAEARGFPMDLLSSVIRNVTVDMPQLGLKSAKAVESIGRRIARDAIKPEFHEETGIAEDYGPIGEAATGAIETLEDFKSRSGFLTPKRDPHFITEGVGAASLSLSSRLPGAAVGAAVGSVVPAIGTLLGGIIGYIASGAVGFGLAEYQSVIDEAEKEGISRKEAESAAVYSGMAESGFEFLSDVITFGMLKLFKPLTAPVEETMKSGIRQIFKLGFKEKALQAGSIMLSETGTEMITAGIQAEQYKKIGLGDETFWEGVTESFGPSFVASTIFAAVGVGAGSLSRRSLRRSLEDKTADPEQRMMAAKEVERVLRTVDNDTANVWAINAEMAIANEEGIDIDNHDMILAEALRTAPEDTVEAVQKREAEIKEDLQTEKRDDTYRYITAGVARGDIDEDRARAVGQEFDLDPSQINQAMIAGYDLKMLLDTGEVDELKAFAEQEGIVIPESITAANQVSALIRESVNEDADELVKLTNQIATLEETADTIGTERAKQNLKEKQEALETVLPPAEEFEVTEEEELEVLPEEFEKKIEELAVEPEKEAPSDRKGEERIPPIQPEKAEEAPGRPIPEPKEGVAEGARGELLEEEEGIALAKHPDGTLKTKSEYTPEEWKAYTKSVVDKKVEELAKPLTKKEQSAQEYKTYLETLTDEQKAQVKDLIVDEPKSPGIQKLKIQKALAKAEPTIEVQPWMQPQDIVKFEKLKSDLERKGAGSMPDPQRAGSRIGYKITQQDDGSFTVERTEHGIRTTLGRPLDGFTMEEARERAIKEAHGDIGPREPVEEKAEPLKFPTPKESKVTTMKGRIKEFGGMAFGKVADKPKYSDLIRKLTDTKEGSLLLAQIRNESKGLQADKALEDLSEFLTVEERSWDKVDPIEGFLQNMIDDPKGFMSRKVLGEDMALPEDAEFKPEAPPEGEYRTIRAEDLPEGKKITLIDNKSKTGWDVYEVTEKDPFSITLVDGETIELKPMDKVQMLRTDVEKMEKPPWDRPLPQEQQEEIRGDIIKLKSKAAVYEKYTDDTLEGRFARKEADSFAKQFKSDEWPHGLERPDQKYEREQREKKEAKEKAKPSLEEIYATFDENERAGVRHGLFPIKIQEYDLTPQQSADLIRMAEGPLVEGDKRIPSKKVADKVEANIADGMISEELMGAKNLQSWADKAFGGTMAEGKYTVKDMYDALELGVNQYILNSTMTMNLGPEMAEEMVKNLKRMVNRLPTQTKRTEEMDEFQQFSTPPPLGFVANWVANVKRDDVYLEPSAGIGGLAIFGKLAKAKQVAVNELSKTRTKLLSQLGFDTLTSEDASQLNNLDILKDVKATVIVMNPPFSATAGRVKGRRQTKEGAKHIEQALKKLEPNGRLVAIVGKGMARNKPAFQDWWKKIEGEYNVKANIGIAGQEYRKYGTAFDNQILVIDKTGPTTEAYSQNTVEKIEDLVPLLKEVRNARILERERPSGEPGRKEGVEEPIPRPTVLPTGRRPGGEVREVEGEVPTTVGELGGVPVGVEPTEGDEVPVRGTQPTVGLPEEAGLVEPGERGTGTITQPIDRGIDRIPEAESTAEQLQVRAVQKEAKGELTEAIYDDYKPERLEIKDAQPHPTPLVQSAAMAAVSPPLPGYVPLISPQAVKDGKLSDIQLESITYVGEAHEQVLPDGRRKGYFIGDGTGVGKGREIAGVLWDNWKRGRKKGVWISEKAALLKDAQRDIKGAGWNPKLVFPWNKIKSGESMKAKQGIIFGSYDTLKAAPTEEGRLSRLDQLVEWLGEDFDGVIAFDESHNMGNAIELRGPRGRKLPSAKALAGVALQNQLPNARILYVSATGATEVSNLSYASRLDMWGEGTSFSTVNQFIDGISSGGVASMEMVAQNLKATGAYTSRSLSYDGVEYDMIRHDLTDSQRTQYNKAAETWRLVLDNINEALEVTDGANAGRARANAMSIFWGANQRFFNQLITSLKMPSLIGRVHEDLKNGRSVIVQLVNTLDAAQERSLARLGEEDSLEDLDLSPFDDLMQMVERAFPTTQYQEVSDDQGNTIWVPVTDSQGNVVENAEAVQMREDLLDDLGALRGEFAEGPIDQLIAEFGGDVVAEITGRKRRVVEKITDKGTEKVIEKRSESKINTDADAFMALEKRVLIFSEKGGTGRSYHADLDATNQQQRAHYLLQAGWRADKAIQGLGRSHRSNQAHPPIYHLVTTDLKGEARFISSIARRLDQLGALTKGSRETGSQGIFQAKDNLETQYAEDALQVLLRDIYNGDIPTISVAEFESQTALTLVDDEGNFLANRYQVKNLLNRILSMEIEKQNEFFDEFTVRLEEVVDYHAENGTLDVGLETLRGDQINKVSDEVVHTDDKSGAETKYVQIDVTNPAPIFQFEDADKFAKDGFYKNKKSGRIWGARERNILNRRSGDIENKAILKSPTFTQQSLDLEKIKDEEVWEKLSDEDAVALWNDAVDKLPKTITERRNLVTGVLLPVWNRLIGHPRIMRVQTDDGEVMIGRLIAPKDLSATLKRLGATQAKIAATPKQMHTQIIDNNYRYELANGWELKRKRVSGDYRIELSGIGYGDFDILKNFGVFSERIYYQTRYFIPTDTKGPQTLKRLLGHSPAVEEIPPHGQYAIGKSIPVVGGKPIIELVRKLPFLSKQNVGLSAAGDIWIRTKKGHGFTIKAVNNISPDRASLEIEHGRMLENGELITGKYQAGTIELHKDMADEWTLAHETMHWMEDIGLISVTDADVLSNHIKNLAKKGQWDSGDRPVGGAEDRAVWLSQFLRDRSQPGMIRNILNKIADFVDMIVSQFVKTARSIGRDVESGKVFNKIPTNVAKGMAYEQAAQRWHSGMELFISDNLPEKGTPESFKQTINSWAKKGKFKGEELEWSGLNEWLDEQKGKITSQEVFDYLEQSNVRITEVVRGRPQPAGVPTAIGEQDLEITWTHDEIGNPVGTYQTEFTGLHGGESFDFLIQKVRDEDGIMYDLKLDGALIGRFQTVDIAMTQAQDELRMILFDQEQELADMGVHPEDAVLPNPADFIIDAEMSWGEAQFVEPGPGYLDEEVKHQKKQLIEDSREDFLDEDGEIDEEYLEDQAHQIAYRNYSEFDLSAVTVEDESQWSIRYSSDNVFEIFDAQDNFVEHHDFEVGLDDVKQMVFAELEIRGLAITEDRAVEMEEAREAVEEVETVRREGLPTKYKQHRLPGGERYRELLLRHPGRGETEERLTDEFAKWIKEQGLPLYSAEELLYEKITEEQRAYLNDFINRWDLAQYRQDVKGRFISGHWEEPDVLAHVRFDERTGPNGEKVLHIAEIQSDWHQKGRRKGYDRPITELKPGWKLEKTDVSATGMTQWTLKDERGLILSDAIYTDSDDYDKAVRSSVNKMSAMMRKEGVIDAPFKKTWPLLTIKRMVRYAAEHGFDVVSWDTGKIQADRYNLSKYLSSINVKYLSKTGYEVEGWDRSGERIINISGLSEEALEDHVGKDLAQKAVEEVGPDKRRTNIIFEGLELEIGGEGMKGFYDKMLPAAVNKFFNKKTWGKAKVGKIEVPVGIEDGKGFTWLDEQGITMAEWDAMPQEERSKIWREQGEYKAVHSLTITPEMKMKALREGMPMFQIGKLDEMKAIDAFPERARGDIEDARGLEKQSFFDRILEGSKEVAKSLIPGAAFPSLSKKEYGNVLERLRIFREVSVFSKRKAERDIKKIVGGLTPEEYDTFSYRILVGDILSDIDKEDGPLADWEMEGLPFSFETRDEVADTLERLDIMLDASPKAKKAFADRQKYMRDLRVDLVKHGFLPKNVLDNEEYWHHQVLDFMMLKQGTGTASGDVRAHKKGSFIRRVGSRRLYNTEYVESEYEVLGHGISSILAKEIVDDIGRDQNIIGELKGKAKAQNEVNTVAAYKASLGIDQDFVLEGEDHPLFPFRRNIAMSMGRLSEMADRGELYGPPEFERVIDDLADRNVLHDDPMLSGDPGVYSPGFFQYLSYMIQTEQDGANWAATIFKAIRDRNNYMKATLGKRYQTWQTLLKRDPDYENYVDWSPKPNSAWYLTNSVSDNILDQVFAGEKPMEQSDIRKVLARGMDKKWVVPKELAAVLDGADFTRRQEQPISIASEAIMNWWKRYILINPVRIAKYNLNNLSGDADIAMAYDPEIFKHFNKAAKDLWKWHYNKEMTPELEAELEKAEQHGIVGGGMTVHDIPDITSKFTEDKTIKAVMGESINLIGKGKGAWEGLKNFTTWRENILRLATMRRLQQRRAQGRPTPYAASNRDQVNAIKDPYRQDALVARELIGDYGNLSKGGQWLRRKMIPFYSWMEINAPRYVRMIRNLPHEGEKTTRAYGMAGVSLGKKGAAFTAKALTFYTMVMLWNHWVWPEEEEALGDHGRRQLHIILGRREDGSIYTLRLQGALSDALAWFGAEDFPTDVSDLATRKKSVYDWMAEDVGSGFANRLYQSIRPDAKLFAEVIVADKATYPDVFRPRPIRDPWEHISRTVSADILYRWAFGKPHRAGDEIADRLLHDISSLITYKSDPGEIAYHTTRRWVGKYLEKEGIERPHVSPTSKSNALYYYKQALKYGDYKAAEKYLLEYKDLGGTKRGMRGSIKRGHPLLGMRTKYRKRFKDSLSPKERQTLERGIEWYKKTYSKK